MQNFIFISRFIGYVGVSISSLIFPILIYKITESVQLAGIIMLIEWIPKLLVYLFGGHIIHKLTPRTSYLLMDILRAFVFILFGLSVFYNNYYYLLLAAPIAQCCNALSNIIFESLVSHWWKDKDKIHAHSTLMKIDIFAGVLIVPIISFFSLNYILIIGFIVFIINFISAKKIQYAHVNVLEINANKPNFKNNLIYLKSQPKLLLISLVGLANSIPIALISSQIPFFINQFNSELNLATSTIFISSYKAIISIFAIVFLFLIKYIKNDLLLANGSRLILIISLFLIFFVNNLYVFLISFIFASISYYCLMIYTKNYRQNLIPNDKRIELTGLLISIEAFSYIFASILLIFLKNNLLQTIIVSLILIIVFTYYQIKVEIEN